MNQKLNWRLGCQAYTFRHFTFFETIDMNAAEPRVEFSRIDDFESEFPQCDPRYAGQSYRHGWYTSPDGNLASGMEVNDQLFNTIGHFDHESGAVDRFSCGQAMTSEALFVPKAADSAEGEGYLLAVVRRSFCNYLLCSTPFGVLG